MFEEPNVLYNVGVSAPASDDYIFIADDGFTSSEWRVIPSADRRLRRRV